MKVSDYSEVDSEEGNEGNDDCEEDPAVGDVVLDVVAVHPEVCLLEPRLVLFGSAAVVKGSKVPERREQHVVVLLPLNLGLEELGKVDKKTETNNGKNVVPRLPVLGRKMERVADPKEPFDGDGHRHEDGPTEADVGDGVDDVGKTDGVCIVVNLEGLEGVVDPPDDDVDGVEASQSHQKLMETVTKFWF